MTHANAHTDLAEHADHHAPQSFWTKYVWSQDHKVIAIQYACVAIAVGLVGVGLSNLMRLQLGFPGRFEFIDATHYYQFMTMHGMIMVIYLLTALFLGGFGKFPGTVPTLFILNYVQAHHLDLAFYDRFFQPGAYLRSHADHMQRWHG